MTAPYPVCLGFVHAGAPGERGGARTGVHTPGNDSVGATGTYARFIDQGTVLSHTRAHTHVVFTIIF